MFILLLFLKHNWKIKIKKTTCGRRKMYIPKILVITLANIVLLAKLILLIKEGQGGVLEEWKNVSIPSQHLNTLGCTPKVESKRIKVNNTYYLK